MARTALTVQTLKQDNYAVQAGDLALAFASDVANGNQFASTGQEILIAQNTDAVNPYTLTVTSVPDHMGRTQDIAAYSVPAGTTVAIQMSAMEGWKQSDGNIYVSSSNAALKFAVVKKA